MLPLRKTTRAAAAANYISALPTADLEAQTLSKEQVHSLLSSRPNLSSISRLLKTRRRMGRLQVPSRTMRLPTATEQRARRNKAQAVARGIRKNATGRSHKADVIAAAPKTLQPCIGIGGQEQPIVIDEDEKPPLRPENAPISYMDTLLWPAERLATPDISSFRHTSTEGWRAASQTPLQTRGDNDPSRSSPSVSHVPFHHTALSLCGGSPNGQTGLSRPDPRLAESNGYKP